MAAATTADVTAGTRRPVVRSEKFVEWQRELSSIRAAYGGRRRYDAEAVTSNGVKKHPRKSDDEAVKGAKISEERDAKGEQAVAVSEGDMNTDKAKVKKQQQRHRPDSKTLQKDMDVDSKKTGPSKRKEAIDPLEGEVGRQRRRRQPATQELHLRRSQDDEPSLQNEQQAWPTQPINRRRRRMFTADHELQASKRNESGGNAFPADLSYGRGSKRSRRLARRLANEEPQPQPLKLPKLHLVLTRKEIQEDWFKITGQRYAGKPRKSTLLQLGLGLCTSLTCPSTIRYLNDPQ